MKLIEKFQNKTAKICSLVLDIFNEGSCVKIQNTLIDEKYEISFV